MRDGGDPSEWPAKLPHLRDLDSAMRCSICSEVFSAPKMLPCGHACALPVATITDCELDMLRAQPMTFCVLHHIARIVPAVISFVHSHNC
jgi:hypothetical protein